MVDMVGKFLPVALLPALRTRLKSVGAHNVRQKRRWPDPLAMDRAGKKGLEMYFAVRRVTVRRKSPRRADHDVSNETDRKSA
jgi:hypothetical protein